MERRYRSSLQVVFTHLSFIGRTLLPAATVVDGHLDLLHGLDTFFWELELCQVAHIVMKDGSGHVEHQDCGNDS